MAPEYGSRLQRMLSMYLEIKCRPRQSVSDLASRLGVGRSQFYEDRKYLEEFGFRFRYDRSKGCFVVEQDRYMPIEDLNLSERLILILGAMRLSSTGDYTLSHHGLQAARKLMGSLEGPLRESVCALFDGLVTREGLGCKAEVLDLVSRAIAESRRIRISYRKPSASTIQEAEVDPYWLIFRKRALYLEGYAAEKNDFRTYRLNRIQNVRLMGMIFQRREEYDFATRSQSLFSVFSGKPPQKVAVRFSPRVRPYIEETLWHHSQQLSPTADGGVILTLDVAEPREVLWWAFEWGADAEVLEPEGLRQSAISELKRMTDIYGRPLKQQ
jgi:predicted DNA-binding transcriptional regulator YafY